MPSITEKIYEIFKVSSLQVRIILILTEYYFQAILLFSYYIFINTMFSNLPALDSCEVVELVTIKDIKQHTLYKNYILHTCINIFQMCNDVVSKTESRIGEY